MPTPVSKANLQLGQGMAGLEGEPLHPAFYQNPDVVQVARALLGMVLCTFVNSEFTAGIIVETEAYSGRDDRACHAHLGRRTERTQVMYAEGGVAYVYLCYGLHNLFNIVTNVEGTADAVLVRALEPLEGLDIMARRRGRPAHDKVLCMGPGAMAQALAIGRAHYGASLQGPEIWVEDRGIQVPPEMIKATPRIGVAYAGEDALLPWRFVVAGSPYVSKGKLGA